MYSSHSSLTRRRLLQAATAGAFLPATLAQSASPAAPASPSAQPVRAGFAVDDIRIRLHSPQLTQPVRLVMLADTHLFRDDERGAPYREYSGRMARAYNQTRHFRTLQATQPETCFEETIQTAQKEHADAVLLVGDIVSFPSEAAIEWVQSRLAPLKMPWRYTAGNHDWHYEGLPGTSMELRRDWSERRLRPLHQGANPLMSTLDVGGLRVVLMDNSTYEILPEQLAFFKEQVATGLPLVLMVHIPLYAPGRPVGFGCGHPAWGAQVDKGYTIERRPAWRQEGHTAVTMEFHREVFASPNLLGVFAGHTHKPSLDVVNGIPLMVAGANATGAHLVIEVQPPSAV